jgi:hypothetical protein
MSPANLTQEDQSTLLLLECGEVLFESYPWAGENFLNLIASPQLSVPVAVAGALKLPPATLGRVHLVEEKVFADFNDEVKDSKWWVLDTGTSNHMTSICEVFAELNSNIHGMVKFGDGSVVQMEGVRTVLFICKNGEHRSKLTGVYLIPKMTTNMVRLAQLDEIGYEVVTNGGVMRV